MSNEEQLNKFKLDLLCKELSKLLDNEAACERYEHQSHVLNNVSSIDYTYKDIRGFERYVR